MSKLYWGTAFCQTDFGGLWVHAKVRPRWWWWLCGVRLFLSLVWRMGERVRMDAATAWEIARIIHGDDGPVEVRRGPIPENLK